MTMFAEALADPALRGAYLGFSLVLLVLPLVVLWLWYRRRANNNTVDRPMLINVALFTLIWMGLNAATLGLMMWADSVNAAAG